MGISWEKLPVSDNPCLPASLAALALPNFLFPLMQGGGEPRIWFLTLHVDDKYPTSAPTIKFTSKISGDFVDSKGNVSEGTQ